MNISESIQMYALQGFCIISRKPSKNGKTVTTYFVAFWYAAIALAINMLL